MATDWDIYGDQTDAWGFTRYSLAVHAPDGFSDRVFRFRRAIGLANLTSEPHVSICTALFLPADLDLLMQRISRASRDVSRFRLVFTDAPMSHWSDSGGGLDVLPTNDLLRLRSAAKDAVDGMARTHGDPSRPYQPHVTLYQQAQPDEAAMARRLADDFDFPDGFEVASIELVGRVGPPRGGSRTIIRSFELG